MSLGKFFRRAIAPVLRAAAPVAAIVNPALGAGLGLLAGLAGPKDRPPGSDAASAFVSPGPMGVTGGIDENVREQARRLVQATERNLPSLASAGLSAAIASKTRGQPEPGRFLPLPAGLVSAGQSALAARADQRAARDELRTEIRQQSCATSSDRPASLVVNITNTNTLTERRSSSVNAARYGAARHPRRARRRRNQTARARA